MKALVWSVTLGNAGFGLASAGALLTVDGPAGLRLAALLLVGGWLCDMIDGPLARHLRLRSEAGATLDSLCDAITFGMATALLILEVPRVASQVPLTVAGAAALLYLGAVLLRLARFAATPPWFVGLPSPAMALLVSCLSLLAIEDPVLGWMVPCGALVAAGLGVSRLRYPDLPKMAARRRLLGLAVLAALGGAVAVGWALWGSVFFAAYAASPLAVAVARGPRSP